MPALRRKGDRLDRVSGVALRRRGVPVLTPPEPWLDADRPLPQGRPGARAGEGGAVVDLRPPDIVRITPAPLYNSFEDVHRFCARIAESLDG